MSLELMRPPLRVALWAFARGDPVLFGALADVYCHDLDELGGVRGVARRAGIAEATLREARDRFSRLAQLACERLGIGPEELIGEGSDEEAGEGGERARMSEVIPLVACVLVGGDEAMLAALLDGQGGGLREVARRHGVDPATLRRREREVARLLAQVAGELGIELVDQ